MQDGARFCVARLIMQDCFVHSHSFCKKPHFQVRVSGFLHWEVKKKPHFDVKLAGDWKGIIT